MVTMFLVVFMVIFYYIIFYDSYASTRKTRYKIYDTIFVDFATVMWRRSSTVYDGTMEIKYKNSAAAFLSRFATNSDWLQELKKTTYTVVGRQRIVKWKGDKQMNSSDSCMIRFYDMIRSEVKGCPCEGGTTHTFSEWRLLCRASSLRLDTNIWKSM